MPSVFPLPLPRLEVPLSPAHLFVEDDPSPSHITLQPSVYLALDMGSKVRDRHTVPSSAPSPHFRSSSRPLKSEDPGARSASGSNAKNREGGSWQVAARVREAFALSNKNDGDVKCVNKIGGR